MFNQGTRRLIEVSEIRLVFVSERRESTNTRRIEMREKPRVRIEDWYILGNHLYGETFGHPSPHIQDGKAVRTSTILSNEEGIVVTQNTIYELGKEKVLIYTEQSEEQPS